MRVRVPFVGAVLVLFVASMGMFVGAQNAAPKYKIKDVMKIAMKGKLCAKVASGKADEAQTKKLVELFEALTKNKPPKGDEKSWKAKTGALLAAAKLCLKDPKKGQAALGKAANCKACHKVHK